MNAFQKLFENKTNKEFLYYKNNSDKQDTETPHIYSRAAIYIFSISFSVLFGSFLMAANRKAVGKPAWPAILFGLIYTAVAIILYKSSIGPSYTFVAHAFGAVILSELFWNRDIGKNTDYKARPIWKPLIIGIALFMPLFLILLETTK